MRSLFCRPAIAVSAALIAATPAIAAPCANPHAMGVSRVMQVDARAMPLIGTHDYGVTLPLAPGEIVLTFDDGPLPPYTNAVLKALADECLLATFFMVGRQAQANPQMVWQVRAAGHTVGTHTQNHLLSRMAPDRAAYEIDTGIASVGAALGSPRALAPFFRFPGLLRTTEAEHYLRSRGLNAWSIDVDSYDYRKISTGHMLQHTLEDLEKRRGGVLLMHDVQPKTALTLPTLLRELKTRGYRIVHVVPTGTGPVPDLVARAPAAQPQGARPAFPIARAGSSEIREVTPRDAMAIREVTLPRDNGIRRGAEPPEPERRQPNGLFEAIFTSSAPQRWGR